jgi:hypothetical protein
LAFLCWGHLKQNTCCCKDIRAAEWTSHNGPITNTGSKRLLPATPAT